MSQSVIFFSKFKYYIIKINKERKFDTTLTVSKFRRRYRKKSCDSGLFSDLLSKC